MKANDRQVGGEHYKSSIQHWDYVIANDLDYFQAQITKYVTRWKKKDGIEALEKARHFLDKYIEVERARQQETFANVAREVLQTGGRGMPPKIQKLADRLPDPSGQKHPFGFDPANEI